MNYMMNKLKSEYHIDKFNMLSMTLNKLTILFHEKCRLWKFDETSEVVCDEWVYVMKLSSESRKYTFYKYDTSIDEEDENEGDIHFTDFETFYSDLGEHLNELPILH